MYKILQELIESHYLQYLEIESNKKSKFQPMKIYTPAFCEILF